MLEEKGRVIVGYTLKIECNTELSTTFPKSLLVIY